MQNGYSFHSQENGQIFTIFQKVNCESHFVICFLECRRLPKQYVGKVETDFNKHCNDVYKADAIQTSSCHFVMKNHIFNRDASSIIIEQIWKNTSRRQTKKQLLNKEELLDHETRNFKTFRSPSRTEHIKRSK